MLGAAENLQTETGIRLMPHMQPVLAHARETIVASLGIPALELEIQAGKRMSTDEAVAYALDEKKPARRDAPIEPKKLTPLSKRELEIAHLIADGMSNKEIATRVLPLRAHGGDARIEHPQQTRYQLEGGGCALGRARAGPGLDKALRSRHSQRDHDRIEDADRREQCNAKQAMNVLDTSSLDKA